MMDCAGVCRNAIARHRGHYWGGGQGLGQLIYGQEAIDTVAAGKSYVFPESQLVLSNFYVMGVVLATRCGFVFSHTNRAKCWGISAGDCWKSKALLGNFVFFLFFFH